MGAYDQRNLEKTAPTRSISRYFGLDPLQILAGALGLLSLFVLVIIGILVIVLVVGALIVFLPAIIVALVVWFFTGSFFFAGIAFLIVAIISLVAV